ncbi:MAG: BlaI/MecI/CopY family transcriptional regulator [Solirubrobacterales bacterium]|nr:BlaI/MecI/CopY family transcriptional regulator [Solirubrobacterales bacterium]MBV9798778.1 BlaI/MecI/CopY family transcriptional regulator [Solirubrobacterales bacterium]
MSAPRSSTHGSIRVPPPLHELEAEVMEAVWERGEASVREVMRALNAGTDRERAYTTIMTIMARLGGKGLLERRRQGKTDLYSPRYTRDQYADLRARAELDSIVDQFGELALAHIARQWAGLDPQRRRALQRLARET